MVIDLKNIYGERLEIIGDLTINLEYWDCECESDFIHSISENICSVCNSEKENNPNSRENEIEKLVLR